VNEEEVDFVTLSLVIDTNRVAGAIRILIHNLTLSESIRSGKRDIFFFSLTDCDDDRK
jgi:hypothetical protein